MNHRISDTCIVCDGKDFAVLFDRDVRVLLCNTCCLMFVGDRDKTDLTGYYTSGYYFGVKTNRVGSFATRRRAAWLSGHMRGLRDKRVLEIGCGQGHLLKTIQNQGARVHGVEPSVPDGLIAGSLSGHDNISICMLSDFHPHTNYDAVLLNHTLEHLADPIAALRQIHTFLTPGGLLYIEVPNFFSLTGFYRNRKGLETYPSPNHLFIYTPATLSGLLGKTGFETVSRTSCYPNMRAVFRPGGTQPARIFSMHESRKRVWRFFLFLKGMAGLKNIMYRLLHRTRPGFSVDSHKKKGQAKTK